MTSSPSIGLKGAIAQIVESLTGAYDEGAPGLAVAVQVRSESIFAAVGLANLEHEIPIAPATVFHVVPDFRQVTARCVALLAEDGALSPTTTSDATSRLCRIAATRS